MIRRHFYRTQRESVARCRTYRLGVMVSVACASDRGRRTAMKSGWFGRQSEIPLCQTEW
jgi:hypothetical protein